MRLGERFDEVRSQLLQAEFADRLAKPLEYWVLPSDRRLPLALLNRSLQDLLATPFAELTATPGIGQKKISSLVKLLDRATRDEPPLQSVGAETDRVAGGTRRGGPVDPTVFDPAIVSEALWTEWRQSVGQFGIDDETLGRLAPSLQRLPTVIWQTPIRHYLDHSVAEIRRLRTHGEKRVRCVLEVFHSVYHRLQRLTSGVSNEEIRRQLTPQCVRDLAAWVERRLAATELPTSAEVQDEFVRPLLDLIEIDCGETVCHLVAERLGFRGEPRSVREQARQLGVTRARVYQLLDDCGKVLAVRWPAGTAELNRLNDHFALIGADGSALRLFYLLSEICFPMRSAGEPAERESSRSRGYAAGHRERMVRDDQPDANEGPHFSRSFEVARGAAVSEPVVASDNGDAAKANTANEHPAEGANLDADERPSVTGPTAPRHDSREATLVGQIGVADSPTESAPRVRITLPR